MISSVLVQSRFEVYKIDIGTSATSYAPNNGHNLQLWKRHLIPTPE